jgi:hypothetical protein
MKEKMSGWERKKNGYDFQLQNLVRPVQSKLH